MADEALFPRYLPEDLISSILLRLPIRSLLVCTSISKPWNSFIKSSAFISSHLNHNISSRKETDSELCLLQICSLPANTGTDSYFLQWKDREMSEYDRLQFPFPSDQSGYQVVSSCNGIVYFTNGRFFRNSYPAQWILWNPAIKKTMVISERHNARALEASGIGFDSKTGDFKVLSVIEEAFRDENLMVHIYSLKVNSWKWLPDIDFVNFKDSSIYREMAFLNGVLHFVGKRSHRDPREPRFMILGFDLADEVFHEIMLPDCMAGGYDYHFVSTRGESLSVLWLKGRSISNMEIWVMKEYGVEGSWTKVSTVRLDSLLVWTNLSITGYVFVNDSHVLLSVGSKNASGMILSHDLKSQETTEIAIGGRNTYCYLGNYVESLVLLSEANDQKPSEVESDDENDASGIGSSGGV